MLARVRSLTVLLVAVTACATPPVPDLAKDLAGVPSADEMRGVRLGMSLADLRRARPDLRKVDGRMLDTAGGYVLSYQVDGSTADSAVVAVWSTREFASNDDLTAAWSAALRAAGPAMGRPVACYDSPVATGSTESPPLRAALWEAGPMQLSAVTSSRRRAVSAMFYDAASPPHERRNVYELTVSRRRAWERMASVAAVLAPNAQHACGDTTSGPGRTLASGEQGSGASH